MSSPSKAQVAVELLLDAARSVDIALDRLDGTDSNDARKFLNAAGIASNCWTKLSQALAFCADACPSDERRKVRERIATRVYEFDNLVLNMTEEQDNVGSWKWRMGVRMIRKVCERAR